MRRIAHFFPIFYHFLPQMARVIHVVLFFHKNWQLETFLRFFSFHVTDVSEEITHPYAAAAGRFDGACAPNI